MKPEDKLKMMNDFKESKDFFLYYLKPNYDKYYKMFASYTGDRAEELEKINGKENKTWQSNVFIPLIFSYIKQYLQKTVGVAPDYTIKGKNSSELKEAIDMIWKKRMCMDQIDYFLQTFIFGWTIGKDFLTKEEIIGFESGSKKIKLEDGTIKDKLVRKAKVLKKVFWPDFDVVSVYSFFYNPRMRKFNQKGMRKFQRHVFTYDELMEYLPDMDSATKKRLLNKEGKPISLGDPSDYEYVKKQVMEEAIKSIRETTKDNTPSVTGSGNVYNQSRPSTEALYEVIECEQGYNRITFIPQGTVPIILKETITEYDHGESLYSEVKFFPKPFSIEGIGIPGALIKLQELMNGDVNKIEDALAIRLSGMIAASPTALPGFDQRGSVVIKPTGILWTSEPDSVKKIDFGDINSSNFLQSDKIKETMRQVIGLDEFSTLSPEQKQTATVASFMREATIEGVKLFLLLLKQSYDIHFTHYVSMIKQFWTMRNVVPDEILEVLDDNSDVDFPVKDDDWINRETGEHKLWPGPHTIDVDQGSTLASSTELKRANDKNIWEMVKDLDDQYQDPDTGKMMSIKKFKILMKVLEDSSGWDKDQYIGEVKATAPTNILPTGEVINQEVKAEIPEVIAKGAVGLSKPTALAPGGQSEIR